MDDMLTKYPSRKLKNMDMINYKININYLLIEHHFCVIMYTQFYVYVQVFFPIHAYEHFYMICYNLRNPAYEIIDNIKRNENAKIYYGRIPSILHSHFCKYLQGKDLQNLSKIVQKLNPSYLRMPWQIENNSTDCGIFLMRHMETYKGDVRTWETSFSSERCGQFKQLFKLRIKYNNAILTSHINEKRD